MVIVNVVVWVIFAAASIPLWFGGMPDQFFGSTEGPARWALTSLVFFAYWTYFESAGGQSLGKMALRIKTTDLSGNKAAARSVAIQSFGKAFLLPLDLVLGWIFTNEKRQRLFSRVANTIVIRIPTNGQDAGTNGRYIKD